MYAGIQRQCRCHFVLEPGIGTGKHGMAFILVFVEEGIVPAQVNAVTQAKVDPPQFGTKPGGKFCIEFGTKTQVARSIPVIENQ